MILRPYQVKCATAAYVTMASEVCRILAVLPTGCGKTVIFATVANEWVAQGHGRVMVICPTIELVGQAAEKLEGITKCNVAIEQASSWSNEAEWARADFICASKQSLVSKNKGTGEPRYKRFAGITLVIVDEADLSITKGFSEMLDWFYEQGACIFGVTATPDRTDGKAMGNVYDKDIFTMGIAEAIDDGWLVGCNARCVEIESLDLSEVKTAKGDLVESQLGKLMEDDRVCFEIAAVTAQEMICDD